MVREITIRDAEAYVAVRRGSLLESPFKAAGSVMGVFE